MSEQADITQAGGVAARSPLVDLEGYERFEPDPSSAAFGIDKPIAEEGTCPTCDGSLSYEGYKRFLPRWSYRAFSVCRTCGWFQEF